MTLAPRPWKCQETGHGGRFDSTQRTICICQSSICENENKVSYVVTRKSLALQQYLVLSVGVRVVKGRHEEVQVRRQGLHHGHLGLIGADNGRDLLGNMGIGVQPRRQRRVVQGLEVALDALGAPCVEILLHPSPRPLRLQAQGVSAQVGARYVRLCRSRRDGIWRDGSASVDVCKFHEEGSEPL